MTSEKTERSGSPDRFGYEWAKYSELRPEYQEQFRRWTAPLRESDWRGRRFLDVGCGMGRNSHWPMTFGAIGGVAIDVDDRSLASARRTLASWPSVEVRKMSAYEIAYDGVFDIVFSIGVIHHLARPEVALQQMVKAVKPGGCLLIWVYGYENNEWIVKYFDPLRRRLFSRLPLGVTHFLSILLTALLWLLLRLGFGRIEYFRLARQFPFRHLRSIVFDQMLPRIANYWRRDEVSALLTGAGLAQVRVVAVNNMSWAAIGIRPAVPAEASQ
jgi:SAM-dependent methyltransferase